MWWLAVLGIGVTDRPDVSVDVLTIQRMAAGDKDALAVAICHANTFRRLERLVEMTA